MTPLLARFVAVIVIQSLVLGSMIYERASILRNGELVMLKTEPIDPRSLFRGDYVILNYEISSLSIEDLEGDNEFEERDPIFVAVERRDRFWAATGIYKSWPKIVGDQVVMKGTVDWVNEIRADCPDEEPTCEFGSLPITTKRLIITYGVESYFVPEGAGKEIEQAIREDSEVERVAVQVAIDDEGTAAIKGLYLDGELYFEESIL